MNKNTKKFVVTLLSVLMVLSFMPAMAFAADTQPDADDPLPKITTGHHSWEGEAEEWVVDADYEGLKVLLAPTCDDPGVGEIYCTEDLNGEKCGAKRTVYISPLGHKAGRKIRLSATEILDYLGADADDKAAFFATKNSYCEAYVYACSHCGKYLYKEDAVPEAIYKELTDADQANEQLPHTVPSGIKKCAASFTCTKCKIEGLTNDDYNQEKSNEYHTTLDNLDRTSVDKHVKEFTTTASTRIGSGWNAQTVYCDFTWKACVRLTKDTCKECGEVFLHDPVVMGYKGGVMPDLVERDGDERVPEPTNISQNSRPDLEHAASIKVITKEATCEENGTYEYQCTECTMPTGESGEIEKLAHEYEVMSPFEWSEEQYPGSTDPRLNPNLIYQAEVCKLCKHVFKADTVKPIGFVPIPDDPDAVITYSVIAEANCEQGAWLLATTKKGDKVIDETPVADWVVEIAIALGGIVEINGKYYDVEERTEIPYTPALGHTFGDIAPVADATCEQRAIEGKICSKCNKVDHDTIKEVGEATGHDVNKVVVPPTCGTVGYTFDSCNTCKCFLVHATQRSTGILAVDPKDALEIIGVPYDIVDPVVASGAACSFEWKVIKEATAEADGTKAEVCSVCGAVRNEVPYSLSEDEKKQEARKEAEPVMSQAADIAADKTYTDATRKAIESAQADLKAALAAGTANDVKVATAALQQAIDNAAKKAANTMTVKAKTVKAKANKATTIKKAKAFTVKKAKGKVTFKKTKGNKKISVSKAGKVVVKKGLKKGKTYKVKVRVTAAGNGNYLAKSKTVTLKVKIAK